MPIHSNAQSFRVLTKLAVRFPDVDGIDLTRATLAASLKYPWFHEHSGKKNKKWSAYISETDDFKFAREFHPSESKTLEAELMDWADDVAYSVHDLEDFHRCNAIPWRKVFDQGDLIIAHAGGDKDEATKQRLEAAYEQLLTHLQGNFGRLLTEPYEGTREQREQLRRMTSQLIGTYIHAVTISEDSTADRCVSFEQQSLDEVQLLKQITRDYIIASPALAAQQHGQKKIICDLYRAIREAMKPDSEYPAFLPVRLRYLRRIAGTSDARFIGDCIASLSEAEAIGLHGRLFGTATGSVLDPIVR